MLEDISFLKLGHRNVPDVAVEEAMTDMDEVKTHANALAHAYNHAHA